MTYLEKVTELYELINTGTLMAGFEKFYAENVTMQEIGEEPRAGKQTNRVHEIDFLETVKEFHGAGVEAITSNEKARKTMVESWMDVTYQNGMRLKTEQVAVQTWDGDFIIKEIFYHK